MEKRAEPNSQPGWIMLLAAVSLLALLAGSWGCRAAQQDAPVVITITPDLSAESKQPSRTAATDDGSGQAAQALAARVGEVLEERDGTYGVVVEHLARGVRLEHNARRVFPTASVYKLPLAYEVLRQVDERHLALDDRLTIEPQDALEPEPAGGPAPGDELTVREALRAMMSVSSNSASHALARQLGRQQFNAAMASLGLRETRLPLDPEASSVTTAADMAHLLGLLAREQILSDDSRRELRQLLELREPLDPLPDALPEGTTVLSKTGNLERASNVAGLVVTPSGPISLAIFDEDVDPGDARGTIAELAELMFEHFSQ
jgi:beta-lactamase class A